MIGNNSTLNQFVTIPAPNYALLSNITDIYDATGLKIGRTNSYGTTNSSGQLTNWLSITPGSTTKSLSPFNSGANARLIRNHGINVIAFNGIGSIRSNDAANDFNYMSYNGTFSDLKWTVHMVARIGWGNDPGEFYGLFGNNGSSQAQKGVYNGYDDRTGVSITDMLRTALSKGSTGFISTSNDNNIITTPNEWHVYTWTFDGSLSAANRQKFYIDDVQATLTVTSTSTAVVTTPSQRMEIFNVGNAVVPGVGEVSHIIFQSGVESDGTRGAFIQTLLPYTEQLSVHKPISMEIYQTTQGVLTDYYFPTFVGQDPTTPGTFMKVYRKSLAHVTDASGALWYERSTDWGRTWSAPAIFYDPDGASPLSVGDSAGGYDASGRLWIVCDVRTTGATNMLPFTAKVIYTDDNAATSPTVTDITSSLTVPTGEDLFAFRGNIIITSTGRIMAPYYTVVPVTFATSSNFVICSDDNGASWQVKTVRSSSSTYINEGTLVEVTDGSTTRIINQVRNESTQEWTVFSSTDDGDNWTNDGDQTMGETFTTPHPGYFQKFMLDGVSVVEFMYANRSTGNKALKVVYARESSLAANPLDFDLGTKVTLWPEVMGYGSHFHPYNTLFAIGTFFRGESQNENKLVTAYLATSQINLIISELGL